MGPRFPRSLPCSSPRGSSQSECGISAMWELLLRNFDLPYLVMSRTERKVKKGRNFKSSQIKKSKSTISFSVSKIKHPKKKIFFFSLPGNFEFHITICYFTKRGLNQERPLLFCLAQNLFGGPNSLQIFKFSCDGNLAFSLI